MSKKIFSLILVAGVIVGMSGMPADAKKGKKKAKPIAQTLYLEGTSPIGEDDQSLVNGLFLKMQPEAGSGEKSMGFFNFAVTPNTNCGGNSLMPVFVGNVAGKIVGDFKLAIPTMGTGGTVEVRVWGDLGAQACNEAYVTPSAMVEATIPAGAGTLEATIEDVNFQAQSIVMVQITPVSPQYNRVFYGTEDSVVEFTCIPASGKSCI